MYTSCDVSLIAVNVNLSTTCLFSPTGPGVKVGYEMQLDNRNIDMVPTAVWAMGHDLSPLWNGHVMYEVFED